MQIDQRAVNLFYLKDEKTVSAIYSTYFGLLKHICFGYVHDIAEAEDCAQEAFLRIYDSPATKVKPDVFLAYLCKAAKNLCLDRLKKNKEESLEEEFAATKDDFHYQDELLERLKQILSPEEFDALVMHVCLGLKFDEIGVALSITPSAARGLAYRGKEKAKKALKKEEWL